MHARARQHRKRDDGYFPKIDLFQTPHATRRIAPCLDRLETDRQPVERTGAHERQDLPRFRDSSHQSSAYVETARILADFIPDADWLGRIVLKQHLDARGAAARETFAKRARRNDVVPEIFAIEEARVPLEHAVVERLRLERQGAASFRQRSRQQKVFGRVHWRSVGLHTDVMSFA